MKFLNETFLVLNQSEHLWTLFSTTTQPWGLFTLSGQVPYSFTQTLLPIDTTNLLGADVLNIYGVGHKELNLSQLPSEFYYLEARLASQSSNLPHSTLDQLYTEVIPGGVGQTHTDFLNLASSVEDMENFEALEHVRTNYIATSPNVKLYYPEPFIASASFMHNDIEIGRAL